MIIKLLTTFILSGILNSQISYLEKNITGSADGAHSVFAADIDNDGHMDIISSSYLDNSITWYKNDGNSNPSWSIIDIDTNSVNAYSAFASDIDNDGDMDIISAGNIDDKISWFKNDGNSTPSFERIDIDLNADGAYDVIAADIDKDGDMDILAANSKDHAIAWYENDGSKSPNFNLKIITTNADNIRKVAVGDIDNDGNIDIVSASSGDDKISWYKNDGSANPTFDEKVVSTNADGARSVFAADVDNDGDVDLISASFLDNKIALYKNNGGVNPIFMEEVISTNADGANSIFAADVDNDGDMDLISASVYDDKIALYKNNGSVNPIFTEEVVSTNADGAYDVIATDLDNDGDMDIVSASVFDDNITWYEYSLNYSPILSSIPKVIINEDDYVQISLNASDDDGDKISFSIKNNSYDQSSPVKATILDSLLTLTPDADWNGEVNFFVFASDGKLIDSTSFDFIVNPIQDIPEPFRWVNAETDTINISKNNLSKNYFLNWSKSLDVDNDTIRYRIYTKTRIDSMQIVYDSTENSFSLSYEFLIENFFKKTISKAATISFLVWAYDKTDSVQADNGERVIFVNRYEYLSLKQFGVPLKYALYNNHPNPFNPVTTINFDLPRNDSVSIIIYNILGEKVKGFSMPNLGPGFHSIEWNATSDYGIPLSSGIYFYQMRTQSYIKTQKMILSK